jgi:DNA repair exonuclease SbcCD ATPase subunit
MIKLKHLTLKNFYSIGNQTQAINFDQDQLTLILGENLDQGGSDNGSRNGAGKSAITHALSFALFGQAMTNIKKDNLINRTNGKNMLVTLSFEKDNVQYRIERGRKPAILKFFINDKEQMTEDEVSDSQGDSRETQKSIDSILNMNHLMFKNIVVLNTYSDSFLAMRAVDQREIIENLLGVTLLTEKADVLREQIKDIKQELLTENAFIEATKQANTKIQMSIATLRTKSTQWDNNRDKECVELHNKIENLKKIDIEDEINKHNVLADYNKNQINLNALNKDISSLEKQFDQFDNNYNKLASNIEKLSESKVCLECEQEIGSHKHAEILQATKDQLSSCENNMRNVGNEMMTLMDKRDAIITGDKPIVYYDKLSDALKHQNNLESLEQSLLSKLEANNPFIEQIQSLQDTAIQEISWDKVNEYTRIKNHQEFLLKLLTNKDSFIRKKIIDQNLSYLNNRLHYYLDKIGISHMVEFMNDLSVEINYLGHDLDFHNLSRGEMTRVTLSLSWAFRDVWENLYQSINLLFIDELIDNGMDCFGADNALAIMQAMVTDRNKNIFLISHKEELTTKVNNVIMSVKENGFTTYNYE